MKIDGMKLFIIIWVGQLISLFGTAMTRFALLIWAYQQEGNATSVALLGFFSCAGYIVPSLAAGVLVDRWDRRKVMILADLGCGAITAIMLGLFVSGELCLWHLYLMETVSGFFEAFQSPAYSASISLLIPPEHLTRANGMNSLARYASTGLAPILSGVVLGFAGLRAVLVIDLVTMALAVISLLFLRIPSPPPSQEGLASRGSFFASTRAGFGYIFRQPGLAGLMIIFFFVNLFGTLTYFAVLSPMILARSGGDQMTLSYVQAAMGAGGILGGVLISVWDGAKQRARSFLLFTAFSFLTGDFLFAVSRSLPMWVFAGLFSTSTIPFMISPYYAIWQVRVPTDLQGRVFSARDLVQVASQPFGYLLGGLLADRVFEPAMAGGGDLANVFGWLVGTGPGAGMGLMFLCTCILGCLTGLSGFIISPVRDLEKAE